jgi:integrase
MNLREDRHGIQAYFRYRGAFHSQRFKHADGDARSKALAWLKEERPKIEARVLLSQTARPDRHGPSFETDADTYLAAVESMPSYTDREYHIRLWAETFRGRDRNTVTALEIRTQLERWRRSLSASSCNKRRTALMSFYTKLNGKSGYNPVRDVEAYPEYPEMRSQHPYTILRILACMAPSKTRARLRVILCTGWPHAQLKRLKPEHLDLTRGRAFVTPRRKGKGRAGTWLPLLPAAVDALREFIKWDCFGDEWSHTAMGTMFARAQKKLNAHRAKLGLPAVSVRPYDIRHTFGTALARRITDERALQELMLHSRPEQTRRYTEAATHDRIERALAPLRVASNSGAGIPGDSRGLAGRTRSETTRKTRGKPKRAVNSVG